MPYFVVKDENALDSRPHSDNHNTEGSLKPNQFNQDWHKFYQNQISCKRAYVLMVSLNYLKTGIWWLIQVVERAFQINVDGSFKS